MMFLVSLYPWVKALHVVSMVAWMAGLFYLPRLYVYHCEVARGSTESERFKVMERRLLKQITLPAMIATFVFGIVLAATPGVIDWTAGWWHLKLLSVLILAAFTGKLGGWRRDFLEDRNTRSAKFYRIANEVPTILLLLVVVLVVVKPF